jgi:hypothetical protein
MKNLIILLLFYCTSIFSQLINAPADCPISYRLCNASNSYDFQLVDYGLIDDAKGTLYIPGLPQSAPNQFEWKSCWLTFTPKYSGEFGFRICPETIEKLNFILFESPNCADIETGNYSIITQGNSVIQELTHACTGIGEDPYNGGITSVDFPSPFINIQSGITYGIFIKTFYYLQTGSHRFNLTFQGSAVTDHPDLFDNVACQLATTNNFEVRNNVSVYPNPFNEKINISSNANLTKTEIYDLLGKNVYSANFNNEIDTGFLQAGVYIIKMYGVDNEVFVRKIVKR